MNILWPKKQDSVAEVPPNLSVSQDEEPKNPIPLSPKQSKIKISLTSEETYEVEFNDKSIDHLVLEYNKKKGYVYVKTIVKSPKDDVLRKIIRIGDILISVNNHIVLEDDIADIMAYFEMLRISMVPRTLRFLSVSKCSFNNYIEKMLIVFKNKKDMFGFNRTVDYLQIEQEQRVQNGVQLSKRDIEWVEYLKAIGGPDNLKPAGVYKPSKELKTMVRRGIPVAFRALVWQKISLSSLHRREFSHTYYQTLLEQVPSLLDSHVRDDIEKDIDRTFPEHEYFGGTGDGENSLRRILSAYALHNPTVGYCQSLNFIGGLMLLFMDEEDAFWLLVTIIDTLLPKDYYTKSMVGTYTDQYVLSGLIQEHMPQLHNALENAQLKLPLVTVQWFMCLYVNTLRPEIAMRVWDIFLNEGSKALFRISMALFKLNEKVLLSAKDSGDLFLKLRAIGRDVMDPEILISTAYKSYRPPPPPSSSIASPNITSKYRDVNTSNTASMRPPKDLVGLGLAHLGPIQKLTAENIDLSAESVSATVTVTSGSFSDFDDERILDTDSECSTARSTQSPAVDEALKKLQARGTCTVVLENGTKREIRVSDMMSPSKLPSLSAAAKPSSKINHSESFRSFKRVDIEIGRMKYREEVVKQFEDMETARLKWKLEQIAKNVATKDQSNMQDVDA